MRRSKRVLFIVDRIELARQTLEDFNVVLRQFKPVIYKSARRTGELLGSSVVIATIQSLMTDRRHRGEFTPFYFDLVVNDEAHRSNYGDAREAVQFFQATPKAYLRNINLRQLSEENPKALEARQLRDTYHYFGCRPGEPTFRFDIADAVQDPNGPSLCLPKIVDCRSDITTQALQDAGWTVVINEQEENFKIQDLERKDFTPHRKLTDWPYDKLREAVVGLYHFCCDYPGIRHGGTPANARRQLAPRDATTLSVLILAISGYLSRRQERLTLAVVFDEAHKASRLKLLPTMARECRNDGLLHHGETVGSVVTR